MELSLLLVDLPVDQALEVVQLALFERKYQQMLVRQMYNGVA